MKTHENSEQILRSQYLPEMHSLTSNPSLKHDGILFKWKELCSVPDR